MRKQFGRMAKKAIKKQFTMSDHEPNKKSDKDRHADTIIRTHVLWTMGASYMVALPIADIFAVGALQLDMIRQLCRVYDIKFSETQGKAIVSSLTTSVLTKRGAMSLLKLVPGVGTVVGGIATSILNGASTYALGEVFKKHFGEGGTILDFDVERLRKLYNEKFEKGKKVAEQWKKEKEAEEQAVKSATTAEKATDTTTPETTAAPTVEIDEEAPKTTSDVLAKLRELGALRDEGVISEAEFEEMKKKVIKDFN